jgi:hypothetical protein
MDSWAAGQRVFQVQVVHDAYPSLVTDIVPAMNAFLSQASTSEEDPKTIQDLTTKCGVRMQITRPSSVSVAPIVSWRVGFYIPGGAQQLSALVDMLLDYVEFRVNGGYTGKEKKPFPHAHEQSVKVFRSDGVPPLQLDCKAHSLAVEVADGVDGSPVKSAFEMSGPLGDKWLVLDVEVVDETHVSLGWTGRTWGLRQAFEDAGIPLCEDGDGGFVRVVTGEMGKVESEEDCEGILKIITEDLSSFPCLVRAEDAPVEGDKDYSAVAAFLKKLRELPHILLVKDSARSA